MFRWGFTSHLQQYYTNTRPYQSSVTSTILHEPVESLNRFSVIRKAFSNERLYCIYVKYFWLPLHVRVLDPFGFNIYTVTRTKAFPRTKLAGEWVSAYLQHEGTNQCKR